MKEIISVRIDEMHMDDNFNCRGHITPMDVADLAKDIEQRGLVQPVTVQKYNEEQRQNTGFKYRLLAGYRRTMAHRILGREEIEAIIHEPMSETDAMFLNLAENVNRSELTIMQEARALHKLHAMGIGEIVAAAELNKSRGWIQVRYMLLKLPPDVQAAVEAGFINQTQIRELYTVMKKYGVDTCLSEARDIKDKKRRGVKGAKVKKAKNYTAKKARLKQEIITMLEYIYDITGSGLHTRCLAWACGEISELDLYKSLKIFCDKNGIIYSIPNVALREEENESKY